MRVVELTNVRFLHGTSGYEVMTGNVNVTFICELNPEPAIVNGVVPSMLHLAVLGYADTKQPVRDKTEVTIVEGVAVVLNVDKAYWPAPMRTVSGNACDGPFVWRLGVQVESVTVAESLPVETTGHWARARKVA